MTCLPFSAMFIYSLSSLRAIRLRDCLAPVERPPSAVGVRLPYKHRGTRERARLDVLQYWCALALLRNCAAVVDALSFLEGQMCTQLAWFRGGKATWDRERTCSDATFLPPFRDKGDPAALLWRGSWGGRGGSLQQLSVLASVHSPATVWPWVN